MKSTTHFDLTKAITNNRKVSDMFAPSTREAELLDAVTRAEVLHIKFIAQHNLSLLSSDHMTKLHEKMFPMCIHIFDIERSNKVEVKYFNMCTTSGEHCSTPESP